MSPSIYPGDRVSVRDPDSPFWRCFGWVESVSGNECRVKVDYFPVITFQASQLRRIDVRPRRQPSQP